MSDWLRPALPKILLPLLLIFVLAAISGCTSGGHSSDQHAAIALETVTSSPGVPAAGDQPADGSPAAAASGTTMAAAAPSSPSPSPSATASPTPDPPQSLFATSQVVSFYGHPLSGLIGVLGEGTEQEMLAHLKRQASAYQAINTDKTVVPAIHLIYEVAQEFTSDDGLYLYRTEDETVRHYIELTREQHMLLFLDMQIGRSSLAAEMLKVLPYLREPNVHLAIDPEFVTPPGMRPGLDIGTLDCLTINPVIQTLEQLAEKYHLPNKIVIVHQFQETMLTNKDKLDFSEPRVDVVLNMDGFGDQASKLGKYDILIRQFGARYAGIKLFYKHDVNLLTEQQVEDLDPRPNVIIYQ